MLSEFVAHSTAVSDPFLLNYLIAEFNCWSRSHDTLNMICFAWDTSIYVFPVFFFFLPFSSLSSHPHLLFADHWIRSLWVHSNSNTCPSITVGHFTLTSASSLRLLTVLLPYFIHRILANPSISPHVKFCFVLLLCQLVQRCNNPRERE